MQTCRRTIIATHARNIGYFPLGYYIDCTITCTIIIQTSIYNLCHYHVYHGHIIVHVSAEIKIHIGIQIPLFHLALLLVNIH